MPTQCRPRSNWRRATALSAALLLVACQDDPTAPTSQPPEAPAVGSVLVSAPQTEMEIGASVQLAVTLLNESGVVLQGGVVAWSSSDEAVATVSRGGLVTAAGAGSVRVTASSGGASATTIFRVRPGACGSTTRGTLTPGQSRSDTVGEFDCFFVSHGYSYGNSHGWRFDRSIAGRVRIELTAGDQYYPRIMMTDLSLNLVQVGHPTYTPNGRTARLSPMLPAGEYILWVVSPYEPLGQYTLSVDEEAPCPSSSVSLTLGTTHVGSLAAGDCLIDHGRYADPWTLSLSARTTVQIDLVSDAFDTMLLVMNESEAIVAWDDDGGEGLNSRLVHSLEAGHYTVWATSYGSGSTGTYRITARSVQPSASAQANPGRSIIDPPGGPISALGARSK